MAFNLWPKSIWGLIRSAFDNSVVILTAAGAPTNGTSGTGVKLAGPGSVYVNISNGAIYANTNTKASPTWTILASSSGGAIAGATITTSTIGNTNTVALKDTLFTLQDDGDVTKQLQFQLSGITTGTIRTLTVPDASDTLVGKATTDTLTNKTLTAPTITAPAISGAATIATGATITTPVISNAVQSVAAAGTNQGNAAAITATSPGNVLVTAADATKGAVLPAATVGMIYNIKNADAANAVLKLYPAGTDTINALGASNPISMAAKTSATFMCVVAGAWLTVPLVPS